MDIYKNAMVIVKKFLVALLIFSTINSMDQKALSQKLLDAAHSGTLEQVKKCIAQGAPINCTTKDGKTPLWLALSQHCYDNAELLLQQPGIDVNCAPHKILFSERRLPIHAAVRQLIFHHPHGLSIEKINELSKENDNLQLKVLKLLIQKGADINACDQKRATPLHHALFQSNESLITCLVDAQAKMQENSEQVTPLQLVCLSPSLNGISTRSHLIPMLLGSAQITYVDLIYSLRACKEQYDKQTEEERQIITRHRIPNQEETPQLQRISTNKALLARKVRILREYFFTFLGFKFWPALGAWKGLGHNRMPLDMVRLIAYYSAWNAEHRVMHKHLSLQTISAYDEHKLFAHYGILTTCEQQVKKYHECKQLYPFTSFEEFKALVQADDESELISITENDRPVGTFTLSRKPRGFCTQANAWNVGGYQPFLSKPLYIRNLAIHPYFQGQNIGKSCLYSFEDIARAQHNNFNAIRVECPTQPPWLSQWFRKNGYRVRSVIELPKQKGSITCLEKILK
jgi:hypothetical protein